MSERSPSDPVERIESAIDALVRDDASALSSAAIRDRLVRLKRAESRLVAQIGRLTHLADRSGAQLGTGCRDTAEWLGCTTGSSTRKNRNAAELGEAMERSDALADAVESGRISSDAASSVVGAAGGETVDDELIDLVADLPLPSVMPAVDDWRNRRRPDDALDRAARQRARRYVRLTDDRDGMVRLDGLLDPESGAIVRSTLDGLISQSAFDATERSREQRRHDALVQLAAAESKGDVAGGRSSTRLLATVPFETIVERGSALAHSHVGGSLDPETVRRMACDAGIHRVISGPGSSILDFGHESRLVSDNLVLALVARDQRCRWPGCTIRATWCDAHHIVHWTDHGPTSVDNCVLLCHRHHQLSHEFGFAVSGDGAELRIEFPDRTVRVSRPPTVAPAVDDDRGPAQQSDTAGSEPPDASPPRAGETGRGTTTADALDALQSAVRQLALV